MTRYLQESAAAQCLSGAQIFFAGFSEMHMISEAVAQNLACNSTAQTTSHHSCASSRGAGNQALCRERVYSARPLEARCIHDMSIHYEWKSFAMSHREYEHRRRIVAAAVTHPFVLVVLGVGVHHFTKFNTHSYGLFHNVDDEYLWDQAWIDDYVSGMTSLFELYAAATLPHNVCVVFKSSNIGKRTFPKNATNQERLLHHPSSINGIHHWLDRFAMPLAKRAGIGVVSLVDITSGLEPVGFGIPGGLLHKGDALEGDVYHGYPGGLLADVVLERACALCPRQCGRGPRSSLGLHAAELRRSITLEGRDPDGGAFWG